MGMVARTLALAAIYLACAAFPPPFVQYDGTTESLPFTHLDVTPPLYGAAGCVETNDGVVCPVTLDPNAPIDQNVDIATDACLNVGTDSPQQRLCYAAGPDCLFVDLDNDGAYDSGTEFCIDVAPGIDAGDGTTTVTAIEELKLLAGANTTVTCSSVAGPPKRADCTISSSALIPQALTYNVDPSGTDGPDCGPPNLQCQTIGRAFLNIQADNDNGFATCAQYECVGGTDDGDLCIQTSECAGGGSCTGKRATTAGCGRCFGPGKRCNLPDQYHYDPCSSDTDCGSVSGSCVAVGGTVCNGGTNAGEACWLPSDCPSGNCDRTEPVRTCLPDSGTDIGKVCTSDSNCDSGAGTCSTYDGLLCNENADCGTDGVCSSKVCGFDFGVSHADNDPCAGICDGGPDIRKPCFVDADCRGTANGCSTLTAAGGMCSSCNGGTNDGHNCGANSDCPGGGTCATGTGGCQNQSDNRFWSQDNQVCPATAGALDACTGPIKAYEVRVASGRYAERLSTEVHFHPGSITIKGSNPGNVLIAPDRAMCRGGTEPLSGCAADSDCAGSGTCDAPTLNVSDCFLCRFLDFQAWSSGTTPIIQSFGGSRFVSFREVSANTIGDVWAYRWEGKGNLTNLFWGGQLSTVATTSNKLLYVEIHGATCEDGTDDGETCLADAHCAGGGTCSGATSGDWGIFGDAFLQPGGTATGSDGAMEIVAVDCGNTFNTFIEDTVIQAGTDISGSPGGSPAAIQTRQSSCTLATTAPASAADAMTVNIRDTQITGNVGTSFVTSLSVGADTKVVDQGNFRYDSCRREINGELDYVGDGTDEELFGRSLYGGGGSSWLGNINCTAPPDPQNGECWYDLDVDNRFECYENGTEIVMSKPPMIGVVKSVDECVDDGSPADCAQGTGSTLQDDDELSLSLDGGDYVIGGLLFVDGNGTAADIKLAFNASACAGSGAWWVSSGASGGNTSDASTDQYHIVDCGDSNVSGKIDVTATASGIEIFGGFVGSGPETLTLRWAQQSAENDDLVVMKHSTLWAKRIN